MTTISTEGVSNPERLKEIYDRHNGDLAKTADELGISYNDFLAKYGQEVGSISTNVVRTKSPPKELGRPELRKYILSVRHSDNPQWPVADKDKLASARLKHDAGTHEMCQGRDGKWIIQYLILRTNPAPPNKYFTEMEIYR